MKAGALALFLILVIAVAAGGKFVTDDRTDWESPGATFSDTEVLNDRLQLNDTGVTSDWEFISPEDNFFWGVGVDGSRNVYGADNDGYLHKVDSSGSRVWVRDVSTNHGAGAFRAVNVDAGNNVVYAGDTRGQLFKYDASGNHQWTVTNPEGPGSIESIAVDSNGDVYIGTYNRTVHKYEADGSHEWTWNPGSPWPRVLGVAVNNGYVYAGDGSTVRRLNANDGSPTGDSESTDGVIGALDVGPNGNVYATETSSSDANQAGVSKFPADLSTRIWRDNDPWNETRAITVDGDGNAYTASTQSDDHVRKYDSEGNLEWRRLPGDSMGDVEAHPTGFYAAGYLTAGHQDPGIAQYVSDRATAGTYTSQTFDAGSQRQWTDVFLNTSLNGQSGSVTVQFSDSGFPSAAAQVTFTAPDGENNLSIGEYYRYARFNWSLSGDGTNTPEIDETTLFNMPDVPPSVGDNITNDPTAWQDSPVPVQIQCSDSETYCQQIDWKIFDASGSVDDTGTSTDTSDPHYEDITVGDNNNGVLTLQYRGTDSNGLTTAWMNQTIRVDKVYPFTSVTTPSTSIWLNNDFQADLNDTDSGGSGFASCEYKVWADGDLSPVFWDSRPCPDGNVHPSDQIEVGPGDTCDEEGIDTCNVQTRVTDNAGNTYQTTFEFDIDFSPLTSSDNYTSTDWEDHATPVQLDCDNGDIDCGIQWRIRHEGTGNIVRSGGTMNTPTTVKPGSATNGNLTLQYRANDTYGTIENPPHNQTVLVDKVDPYTNVQNDTQWYSDDFTLTEAAGEMSDDDWGGSGLDPTRCQYRVKDGQSGSWTSWTGRSCEQVTISVGNGAANNCTTDGTDQCWVRTRVYDNATNRYTSEAAAFNIDLSPPDTDNNYTDDEWKTDPQPISITCTDIDTTCTNITWWLEEQDGTVYDGPHNASGTSTEILVGDNNDGELYLKHQGWDTEYNLENPPEEQRIRVDTEGPVTNITGPDPDAWYNDDFTVTINDSASASGLGRLDLYYIVDVSGSFQDEWETLDQNISDIEQAIEDNTSVDMDSTAWALNNSWDAYSGDGICMPGQTLPDSWDSSASCAGNKSIIDDISDYKPYTDWAPGLTLHGYDPGSEGEAVQEGWGMGLLDILDRNPWRSDTDRRTITIGDQDTTGGGPCNDTRSQQLAADLNTLLDNNHITNFGVYEATAECSGSPSAVETQMRMVSRGIASYSNVEEIPELIIDSLSDAEADMCWYRVGNSGTIAGKPWQKRDCPDGNINVTVNATNADCTQEGENTCIVQTKVRSGAGVNHTETNRYNIDLSPPNATCDNCDRPDPVVVEDDVLFTPNISDQPQPDNAGWDTVEICEDSSCDDTYCSYTTSSSDDSCTYTTQFTDGYGPQSFCVYAEDGIGNNQTYCSSDYRFSIFPGIGDPCQTTGQCLFGTCQRGICQADDLPAPQIILQ